MEELVAIACFECMHGLHGEGGACVACMPRCLSCLDEAAPTLCSGILLRPSCVSIPLDAVEGEDLPPHTGKHAVAKGSRQHVAMPEHTTPEAPQAPLRRIALGKDGNTCAH